MSPGSGGVTKETVSFGALLLFPQAYHIVGELFQMPFWTSNVLLGLALVMVGSPRL